MPDDASSAETSQSKTGPLRTRATPKPRAVQRKSKAEREEHARKEAERAKEREISEATLGTKPAARGARGSGRSGRGGRGAASHNDRSTASATTGVFGAGRGDRPDRPKGPVDLGVSEALDGNTTTNVDKSRPLDIGVSNGGSTSGTVGVGGGGGGGSGAGRARITKQDGDPTILLDEDTEELPRRDIEKIWISSDEDDEDVIDQKGKQKQVSRTPKPGTGLRPVRAARTLLEEGQEQDIKNKKVKRGTDDNAVIDVDTDEMQIDQVSNAVKKDPPSSPELGRKASRKSDSKPKDTRALVETVEERAERLRLHEDIEGLQEAFLHKSNMDESIEGKADAAPVFDHTDRNTMFLFQLPPLVPQLYGPDADLPHDADAAEVDQAELQIKTEPGAAISTAPKGDEKNKNSSNVRPQTLTAQSCQSQRLASGLVGKLKIHKSGKVTLDWGGTDMEVRYGTEVDFLQDVVRVEVAEGPEEQEEEDQRKEQVGKAYALGQVHKKMVLIPDWSKLYA